MSNEIKEILDRAKNLKYKCDCCEEIAPGKYVMRDDKQTDNLIEAVYIIDKLLDYITNLQEENERLKLNQTKKVFDTIAGLIKNGETCSYRYLIYDLLEFQEKDYVDLMGGLAITNMLVDYEDYKQRIDKAIEYCNNNIEFTPRLLDIIDILRGDE